MRKLLYCALGRFDTPMKLFRLTETRLNITYRKVHMGKHLAVIIFIQNGVKH